MLLYSRKGCLALQLLFHLIMFLSVQDKNCEQQKHENNSFLPCLSNPLALIFFIFSFHSDQKLKLPCFCKKTNRTLFLTRFSEFQGFPPILVHGIYAEGGCPPGTALSFRTRETKGGPIFRLSEYQELPSHLFLALATNNSHQLVPTIGN